MIQSLHDPRIDALYRRAISDLASTTEKTVDAIRGSICEYERLPRQQHLADVTLRYKQLLHSICENGQPDATVSPAVSDVVRSRSMLGMSDLDFSRAYEIFYHELSMHILRRVRDLKEQTAANILLERLYLWIQTLQSAALDEVALTGLAPNTEEAKLRFVDLLLAGQTEASAFIAAAALLKISLSAEFFAIALARGHNSSEAHKWEGVVPESISTYICIQRTDAMSVYLFQSNRQVNIVQSLKIPQGSSVGVGCVHPGPNGAKQSISEAKRCTFVETTTGGEIVWFNESWLPALLSDNLESLRPLLAAGQTAHNAHNGLLCTVRCFASSGFSLTNASKKLHVHPNTVSYRLKRWQDLTGWDPWTVDGLVRSLLISKLRRFDG